MIIRIPDLLSAGQLLHCRRVLADAEWGDGRVTAGHQSAQVKHNLQLAESSATARELGALILQSLEGNPLFLSAALPARVFSPLFNRYETSHAFGTHVDNAIRQIRGTAQRIRTDLSATLFLSSPDEYDGGELVVEDTYGTHSIKLPAGHLVLYPASSLHRVQPVSRGARTASFFWIQSMVRDDADRALLFDLDCSIQALARTAPGSAVAVQLTGIYHNLIRRWADP